MDAAQFRTAALQALDDVVEYLEVTSHAGRVQPDWRPGRLASTLPSKWSADSEDWTDIRNDVTEKVIPGLSHWASKNFMAYFPATCSYESILGEFYIGALNSPSFTWLCNPAATELEAVVLKWLGRALHLPEEVFYTEDSGAALTSSLSESIILSMAAARDRYIDGRCRKEGLVKGTDAYTDLAGQIFPRLVALGSDQTHSSTAKGAQILGLKYRTVPTRWENGLKLEVEALKAVIAELTAAGMEPFYLTANFGTTSTCTIDDGAALEYLKKVRPEIWVHCDAAYGGAFLILPEIAEKYVEGWLEHLDSFGFNLHKAFLISIDCSSLFVARRADYFNVLKIDSSYGKDHLSDDVERVDELIESMKDDASIATCAGEELERTASQKKVLAAGRTDEEEAISSAAVNHPNCHFMTDYKDLAIAMDRRFRALKVWFVMRSFGLNGLRARLRKICQLGQYFEILIHQDRRWEPMLPLSLGLTCFRPSDQRIDARTIADHLLKDGKITIIATESVGKTYLRLVNGSHHAEKADIDRALTILNQALDQCSTKLST